MKSSPSLSISLFLVVAVAAVAATYFYGRPLWSPVYYKIVGKRTVQDVMSQYGDDARSRLTPYFEERSVPYPPETVTFLVSKADSRLEVWAKSEGSTTFIRAYDIQAQSGGPGPKLREGDRQVPEGFYRIEGLNPNSAFHLSMKLNYPNAFDLEHAGEEDRAEPGSNIFIHGKSASIGCLAMGDTAIEELFVLTVDTNKENVKVVISPTDPRLGRLSASEGPVWLEGLYKQIEQYFKMYRHADGA